MNAVQTNNVHMVESLLKQGVNVNQISNCSGSTTTALMFATMCGHRNIVELLLRYGANVNHVNEHGYTALVLAIMYEYIDIAKLLILYGASR